MFSQARLGLAPPKIDPRTCKLEDYIDPSAVDDLLSETPSDWALGRMWDPDDLGNLSVGCCGPAAAGNWQKMVGTVAGDFDEVDKVTTQSVLGSYGDISGWDGTEDTDLGVVLLNMMNYWRRKGICNSVIDAFVSVSFNNQQSLCTAVGLGGPVVCGFSLPVECKVTDFWDAKPGMVRRSWGGHAVLLFAVSPRLYVIKTWGKVVHVTPEFVANFCDEMYLPLKKSLRVVPGLDWDRLMQVVQRI